MTSEETLQKQEEFCTALAEAGGNVSRAAKEVGIARQSIYRWLDEQEHFAVRFERARRLGAQALEDEARRRAYEGVDKPIVWKGEITDYAKEYSDTLMIFLLKGAMPEKYKEQTRTEIVGDGGGPLVISSREEEDKRLAALLAKVNKVDSDAT